MLYAYYKYFLMRVLKLHMKVITTNRRIPLGDDDNTQNNEPSLVFRNEWGTSTSDLRFKGKLTVGRFHLTDYFIVQYMKLLHGIEIPDSWVSSCFTNISCTDTRKVMYMECCDMLSKDTMNEIRKAVKSPSVGVKIYRSGKYVTKIEFTEERNEMTLNQS